MSEFLAMGGYAGFIWPAYAVAIGGLAALSLGSWLRTRNLERQADALRQQRRERKG
jgi:heme exporter protein D